MKTKYWLYAFSIFAVISLACSFNIPIQRATLRTGPTQTETIEIDPPENGTAELKIKFWCWKTEAGSWHLTPTCRWHSNV